MDLEKILNRKLKPMWLPQMNAPYDYIVKNLDKNGVDWKEEHVKSSSITPTQDITTSDAVNFFSNKLNNNEKIDPVYISSNNEILDGHHRFAAYLNPSHADKKIRCIKIMLGNQDSARILNKIQDVYDATVGNNGQQNNVENPQDINGRMDGIDKLTTYEENYKCIGYRVGDVVNNSMSGNFFDLEKKDAHEKKFSIELTKVIIFNDDKLNLKLPTETFMMAIYPNNNLMEDAKKVNMDYAKFLNRAAVQYAKSKHCEGILYCGKILQTTN